MTDNITDESIGAAARELYDAARTKALAERDRFQTLGGDSGPLPTDDDIDNALEWVVERFGDFLSPRPRDFDPLIAKIAAIEAAFGTEAGSFGDADIGMIETSANHMAQWEGAISTNFTENFLGPLPGIAANHGTVASHLRHHAELMKAIYESGRQDALKIARTGIEAIDAITDCNGEDLKIMLAAACAAGTVLGPILGAATMNVQLTNAGMIAGSLLGGPYVEDGPQIPLGGDTVEQVMDNVRQALSAVDNRIKDEEDQILTALKASEAEVYPQASGGSKGATALVPMRPKVIGADPTELMDGFEPPGPR